MDTTSSIAPPPLVSAESALSTPVVPVAVANAFAAAAVHARQVDALLDSFESEFGSAIAALDGTSSSSAGSNAMSDAADAEAFIATASA